MFNLQVAKCRKVRKKSFDYLKFIVYGIILWHSITAKTEYESYAKNIMISERQPI